MLALPVPVHTDLFFTDAYVRAALLCLVEGVSQLLPLQYELNRAKWEGIVGQCKFQRLTCLSLIPLCALCVCKAGHISTAEVRIIWDTG